VLDAEPVSAPLPAAIAEEHDAPDYPAGPADDSTNGAADAPEPDVDKDAATDKVPMPKMVKHRAFDYRTPLPTEMPVIWPRMVGPYGLVPLGGPGPFGPAGSTGCAVTRPAR
jgi:hypothetical protein